MTPLLELSLIRRIEQTALAALPPGWLMRSAATAVADACTRRLRAMPAGTPVLVLAGPGNNGADALLAGLMLAEQGYVVRAVALPARASADPVGPADDPVRAAWRARSGAPDGPQAIDQALQWRPLVIDGLFGIGLSNPVRGDAAALIAATNASGCAVVAVDLPSGLDSDRGCVVGGADGIAMRAALTVTMIADKPGLHTGAGGELAGTVLVADLGLADQVALAATAHPAEAGWLSGAADARSLIRPRLHDTHKGSYGSLSVIAGAAGMQGAALLAASGAQACGIGKLYICSPDQPVFDPGAAQWMSRPVSDAFSAVGALVIGCGLGFSDLARQACESAFASSLPMVVDADALTWCAQDSALMAALQRHAADRVLTPHPLEAARLLGLSAAQVQADRIAVARRLAQLTGAVVVLKGAGSVVASPQGGWIINGTGSACLATAGTGDVLAGMVGALLAQGLAAFDAARAGAGLHGLGGDLAQQSMPLGIGLAAAELAGFVRDAVNGR